MSRLSLKHSALAPTCPSTERSFSNYFSVDDFQDLHLQFFSSFLNSIVFKLNWNISSKLISSSFVPFYVYSQIYYAFLSPHSNFSFPSFSPSLQLLVIESFEIPLTLMIFFPSESSHLK